MVPLWAAILVGFASGILGTFVRIGHERGAELRTRMLAAADEYLQISMEMAGRVRDLRLRLEDEITPGESLDELGESIQEVKDRLLPLIGRIHLLFGPHSNTAARVRETEAAFEKLRLAYVAWMSGEPDAREHADAVASEVDRAIVQFSVTVRHEVRFGTFSRWVKPPS